MAKIGLVDVDGHNFPNLALMRISAYHKAQGDSVEWWCGNLFHYNAVYMSKVFSFTPDEIEPYNCDELHKGGTGYAISLKNGFEVFDKSKNNELPEEIERMFPDYSLYPQYDFAVSMTSRGCPRGCPFCHVARKEGQKSVKVANVTDFWNGQKHIEVLDPNITACEDKRDLFGQYKEISTWQGRRTKIVFNQGLDIRFLDADDCNDIKAIQPSCIHFAWDNPADDLKEKFRMFAEFYGKRPENHGGNGMVYVLTNFGNKSEEQHIEEALKRIYAVREYGYQPYVMIYDKQHASKRIHELARWCNNVFVFWKTPDFNDYRARRER